MAGKSDYLEDEILDHVLGGGDYTRAATVYIALYSEDPDEDNSGAELTGNGYDRVAVTNNATNFPASSGGAKSNGASITFPVATSGDWLEATHFGILDASSGGNLLYYGPLTIPKTVQEGDTAAFAIGELDISET